MGTLKASLKSTMQNLMHLLLSSCITSHGKRFMYIASLYTHLNQDQSPDAHNLEQLNQILSLVKDSEALLLPSRIHHLVWNKKQLREKMRELVEESHLDEEGFNELLKEISTQIVDCSPRWLRYGRYDDMVQDVFKVLCYRTMCAAA